jgi:acyl-CoA synthetase (AMP-forming)/AMP-acid ligase II/uncharacterized protein YndB with AHSA1/START domain
MPTELIELTETLPHPRERVWGVLGDPEFYPRFIREVAWSERTNGEGPGPDARYRLRFNTEPVTHVSHEVGNLVYRPVEHLVLVSPDWPGGHFSVRLEEVTRGATELRITVSSPDRLATGRASTSWLRKRVREAVRLIDAHLAGRAITAAPDVPDHTAARPPRLTAVRTLARAGVLSAGRPDRLARRLGAVGRWGMTVVGGYRAAAAAYPRRPAVIDERGRRTYADIDQRTTRLANALAEHGVRAGRRVALMSRNHAGMIESMVACGKLGADVLLLNAGLSTDQVVDVVHADRPVLLLADDEFAPLFGTLPPALPWISTWTTDPTGQTVDMLIEESSARPIRPPAQPGRIIVLTSAPTGAPKGAQRRNPPGLGPAASLLSRIPLRAGERIVVAAPMFHTWGLAAVQLATPLHATLVLPRRFDAEATLRMIHEHKCTSLFAVPIMLQRILDLPTRVRDRYDTSSLRVVASSGSSMHASFVTSFMDTFGDVLYNLYGSTEVSWASIADPTDLRLAPTTAGRCPVGTTLGILDEDGRPVPPGVVGRIYVGNAMVFEGYTNGSRLAMHSGLMATGDRGLLHADGRLYVSGRDDDMIVAGGEKVFPGPVEELLLSLPGVRDAAVVGVPDREYGQRFAAYVALHPGARLTAAGIRAYVHDHLPRYAVPRDVIFLNRLPRNATGKVVRHLLGGGSVGGGPISG